MHDKASHFDEFRPKEPTKEEYEMYTAAAKAAGLIIEVVPYGATSHIVDMARRMRRENMDSEKQWYDLLFGDETSFSKIPYDKRFCLILRAGLDDALVVLMVAMLPNVSEIYLDSTPADAIALPWKSSRYHFSNLRRLTAAPIDDTTTWPLGFFNPVFAEAKLETFEAHTCSFWNYAFSSGDPNTDPYIITPVLLIEVLESAKESLEELQFEIYCGELAERFEPSVEDDFIHSLVQFKNLKILSTPAEMWSGHLTGNDALFAERSSKKEERLCRRLPLSLEVLRFLLWNEEAELPLIQLQDLCQTHAQTLPNLKRLLVGPTNNPNWPECFELIPSPPVKWLGMKYVIGKRKPPKNSMWGNREFRRIREQYRNLVTGENENEDGNEVSEPMGQAEAKAMLYDTAYEQRADR
ncbi:hypothetical protein E8E11_000738 [Didymella keratinophila]|nr:hypothetical protein E8E11_000738 [Didymella keratinophila]